jgi:hypothetical protein
MWFEIALRYLITRLMKKRFRPILVFLFCLIFSFKSHDVSAFSRIHWSCDELTYSFFDDNYDIDSYAQRALDCFDKNYSYSVTLALIFANRFKIKIVEGSKNAEILEHFSNNIVSMQNFAANSGDDIDDKDEEKLARKRSLFYRKTLCDYTVLLAKKGGGHNCICNSDLDVAPAIICGISNPISETEIRISVKRFLRKLDKNKNG